MQPDGGHDHARRHKRSTTRQSFACAGNRSAQAAGTTTRGVISAKPRGNNLRRATETVSRTFRIMASSTRKFSTKRTTARPPLSRVLRRGSCPPAAAQLIRRSGPVTQCRPTNPTSPWRKAGQERRQRRCAHAWRVGTAYQDEIRQGKRVRTCIRCGCSCGSTPPSCSSWSARGQCVNTADP